MRVFGDRLTNDEDKLFLIDVLRKSVVKSFSLNFDNVCSHLDKADSDGKLDGKVNTIDEFRGLIFSDIMTPMGALKRYYDEILDYPRL